MHILLNKKAQFFILTSVVIVIVFYTLSKYINPYSFIDTSKAAENDDVFFFENVKEKAVKTVKISVPLNLENNLGEYDNFVENMASEKGFNLAFGYDVLSDKVDFSMVLTTERSTLTSSFSVNRP